MTDDLESRLAVLEETVEDLVERMDTAEERQLEILEGIQQIRGDVREILSLWKNVKGFGTVLGWLGTALKWLAVTGGAAAAVWLYLTKGIKP